MTPEVSVLLPVHNAAPFLHDAVASVLRQTLANFELIVVDDGSTDGSAAIVESFRDERIVLLRHETNRGLAVTLNDGLRHARAPFVARQDSDDLSAPDRFARQLQLFADEPDLALAGSRAWLIDARGRQIGVVDRCLAPLSLQWYGLLDNPLIHTSAMFRTVVVRDVLHGYDEATGHSEDFDLWSRLLRGHRARNLPERLVSYRVHDASMMGEVEHQRDGGVRRGRFEQVVRAVVTENLRPACRDGALSGEEPSLLAGFLLGIDRRTVEAVLDAFLRLLAWFVSAHPETAHDHDFLWTLARQVDAIAYRVQPPSRLAAMRVFARALVAWPRLIGPLTSARSLALVTVGQAARRRGGVARAASSGP